MMTADSAYIDAGDQLLERDVYHNAITNPKVDVLYMFDSFQSHLENTDFNKIWLCFSYTTRSNQSYSHCHLS